MQLPPSADLLIPVGVGVLVAVVAVVALVIGLRCRVDDASVPNHDDWTGEHVGDVAAPPTRTVADAVAAEVLLTNEVGLHARPAALLARTVAELDADVVVRYGDEEANAASVLALMWLSAPGGKSITVVATGEDAGEAVRRIEELAERGFDD